MTKTILEWFDSWPHNPFTKFIRHQILESGIHMIMAESGEKAGNIIIREVLGHRPECTCKNAGQFENCDKKCGHGDEPESQHPVMQEGKEEKVHTADDVMNDWISEAGEVTYEQWDKLKSRLPVDDEQPDGK